MPILLDDREPEEIRKSFDRHKIKYEVQRLEIGDVIDLDRSICIERKECGDFISSIVDGRLQRQVINMDRNFKKCMIGIVGNLKHTWKKLVAMNKYKFIKWAAVKSAIASVMARSNVSIFMVSGTDDFTYVVKKIFEKIDKGTYEPVPKVHRIKNDEVLSMVMSLPRIGQKNGKLLLKQFGNVYNIINASVEELMQVPNIGKQTASLIYDKVREEWIST
ncbi:MAG: ERCC4 domain-containing protein [Promethearchaeota archaeon]|nr:MAG: ERCC4 endonuclease [Helarchaeota virus Nidhogg Meg22_1012]URC17333.1 MAG: ERCC4 domain nuclease [Helarchaeota virus Nidhogg Meg22_1214]